MKEERKTKRKKEKRKTKRKSKRGRPREKGREKDQEIKYLSAQTKWHGKRKASELIILLLLRSRLLVTSDPVSQSKFSLKLHWEGGGIGVEVGCDMYK